MVSRMSSEQMSRNFLADLQGNYRSLADTQRQVSTGKRIITPSDDPVGIAIALGLRRDQRAGEAWSRNIDDSLTWLNTTDRALGQALDVVQRG
jgi:flagellar hook-associated protein 3 FlgL